MPASLPPVGADIPCSMYAANVPLKLNAVGALTLDFKGGINLAVRTSSPDGLVLEVQGFRVQADMSPSSPNSGTTVVLTKSDATLTPLSVLTSAGLLFVKLSLTASSIDKATGVETVLGTTDPAKYATLTSVDTSGNQAPVKAFPPVNQSWALLEAATLYAAGGSAAQGSEVVGTLQGFHAIVNQSA
ncbi:hypothetical protein EDD91_7490 [Streptomyces sp. KS 21]|nr:hypothetical protein EDD91_7490 [Streptomyces sp. KS 21]